MLCTVPQLTVVAAITKADKIKFFDKIGNKVCVQTQILVPDFFILKNIVDKLYKQLQCYARARYVLWALQTIRPYILITTYISNINTKIPINFLRLIGIVIFYVDVVLILNQN